ncbi:uncharacterized protein Tco025E_01479 [Trypanosoma conorhini]|uniref:Uncharacterized protein n=1 Tax=Trypanosoma conorhini TaxID=83891 RepID=A0A422Q8K8_9TRYP|nr:uncharacterized protein Tco025E_01479 [Trypanosoma conorhini]RNF26312.1 hypothetical protein Tco025E_01479 [Trypanosoma conorhini]
MVSAVISRKCDDDDDEGSANCRTTSLTYKYDWHSTESMRFGRLVRRRTLHPRVSPLGRHEVLCILAFLLGYPVMHALIILVDARMTMMSQTIFHHRPCTMTLLMSLPAPAKLFPSP